MKTNVVVSESVRLSLSSSELRLELTCSGLLIPKLPTKVLSLGVRAVVIRQGGLQVQLFELAFGQVAGNSVLLCKFHCFREDVATALPSWQQRAEGNGSADHSLYETCLPTADLLRRLRNQWQCCSLSVLDWLIPRTLFSPGRTA